MFKLQKRIGLIIVNQEALEFCNIEVKKIILI